MTSAERLARLTKPSPPRRNRSYRVGDGPACPSDPKHGPMVVLASRSTYCPHSDHTVTGSGTRSVWPQEAPER